MTKLLNLGGVSVQTNMAKPCYVAAKMTINFNSLIVISVQPNAMKSRYVGTKTMTKLLNLVGVSVRANIAKLCDVVAMIMNNSNHKSIIAAESNLS